jgi:hypothetical protein
MRETKRIKEFKKSGLPASMRDDGLMPAGRESANRADGAMRFAYCALRGLILRSNATHWFHGSLSLL